MSIFAGQTGCFSFRFERMTGLAPRFQMRVRNAWEEEPRSPTIQPGTSGRRSKSFGAIAATRSTQRLTVIALSAVGRFGRLLIGRMVAPSRDITPTLTPLT